MRFTVRVYGVVAVHVDMVVDAPSPDAARGQALMDVAVGGMKLTSNGSAMWNGTDAPVETVDTPVLQIGDGRTMKEVKVPG